MIDRKLYDWRGVELKIGQTIIYSRSIGKSISPSVAEIVGLRVAENQNASSFIGRAFSDDKVEIRTIDSAFGRKPENTSLVMPEKVTVVDNLPTKVVPDE